MFVVLSCSWFLTILRGRVSDTASKVRVMLGLSMIVVLKAKVILQGIPSKSIEKSTDTVSFPVESYVMSETVSLMEQLSCRYELRFILLMLRRGGETAKEKIPWVRSSFLLMLVRFMLSGIPT